MGNTMRPTFSADKSVVHTDMGAIPWDVENDRVMDHVGDHMGEAGRLYQQMLDENDMTYPDPCPEPVEALPPTPQPDPNAGPPPGHDVLLDHENRIRKLEGESELTMEEFLTERFNFRG